VKTVIKISAVAIFIVIVFSINISYSAHSNIDVVLVMDSSGSMKKTDPLSLRIPAAKLFISLLKEDDRVSVVSFSDKSYLLIALTPLDTEGNKNSVLAATDRISSDGLYTNLYEALNKGYDILSNTEETDRGRIIILMSDGMMDVGNPDEDKRLIDKIKNELAIRLEDKGIKVYTIAFTKQSDRKLLEKISKQTGGFYNLALTDKDFHLIFTSIFESLKSPEMLPISQNGFLIDKSVEEVTIVATKGSPDTEIKLNSPDGKSYSYQNTHPDMKWFVSENFDMITVKRPAVGRWEILFSTGENNKAYIITNLKLQTNFDKLYSTFGDPLDVQIWLEKDGKIIQEEDVLNKIDIYIELTMPDGRIMKITPFNRGDGIFNRRIAPFTPGNYQLKIIADGKTFEREKTFVFNIADAKESKEDIQAKIAKQKKKQQKNIKTHSTSTPKPEEQEDTTDQVSWKTVLIQYVSINLVLGIMVLIYFKRKYLTDKFQFLKNLKNLKNLIKKKNDKS
jgi:hypothetical protein